MAKQKRPKLKKFTTERGRFKFPSLNKPDYGSDEYPDPDGSYKVALVLDKDSPEAKDLVEKLQPEYDAAIKAAKEEFKELSAKVKAALKKKKITGPVEMGLYHDVYDRETDEPTGEIEFRFKRKASGKRKDGSKWQAPRPGIFDAKLNKIPPHVDIWGGSEGKINFEVNPYFVAGTAIAGISLKLVGVQVLELVTKGGTPSADQMGFGEEEGDSIEDMDIAEPEDDDIDDDDDGEEEEDEDDIDDEIPF